MSLKHKPLFSCTGCASEQSFHAEDLRLHGDKLWCDKCWDDYCWANFDINKWRKSGRPEWSDLPPFIPEADQKIKALTSGLQAIKQHMQMYGGGNMYKISTVWNIADSTLNKAEEVGK